MVYSSIQTKIVLEASTARHFSGCVIRCSFVTRNFYFTYVICYCTMFSRFLFSLSVPHTIIRINLTPEKPTKKQLGLYSYFCSGL